MTITQLRDYVMILGRRGWLIVLFSLATMASAVAFGILQPTIYRASAVLQVIPARYDFGLISAGQQLLRQFALQIEESPERAQAVIDRLQLDIPIDRFQGYVTVASRTEEFLIQIDVDHPDPNTARDIANALAEDFAQYQAARNLERDRQVRIEVLVLEPADEAEVFWPKLDLLAGAGAVLGLLAGILVSLALEWMESSILRSAREVERHLPLPILGAIPPREAGRRG
ncbi:MAG: hypothetical protein HYZ68_04125 [Chloroflexi bacterium]|nr:hypothetical protein [Chloroflexota bacterium]